MEEIIVALFWMVKQPKTTIIQDTQTHIQKGHRGRERQTGKGKDIKIEGAIKSDFAIFLGGLCAV